MKNYTILKKYTEEIEISEIDFDLQGDIIKEKGFSDISLDYIVVDNKDSCWARESHPIEIDRVISTLEKLKSGGSNYVEIMYHCDHIGYALNGVDVRLATDDEVLENKKINQAKKDKNRKKEIKALEKRLRKLLGDNKKEEKKSDEIKILQLNSPVDVGSSYIPKPPIDRVLREGVGHFCTNCDSTVSKDGFLGLFGEMLCHNKKCPNSISSDELKEVR